MNAPFFKFGFFGNEVSLILAFVIGIAFGFALERGGFGNARILAAQFYFTDMRVLKVMFTAIVTAMLGVYYLTWIGWLDLSLVYISDTYMLPQALGGFILGVGFVIGGYCPGTSVVSFASGRLDGLIFILGVMFGIFVFGVVFPLINSFYYSTYMGKVTLQEWSDTSYGFMVFLVVVMALAAFVVAEKVEKKMSEKLKVSK
ncbi:YeeE/YedE thiosulfate transporter family protein [Melioribacteraceae bacterium 4301-Me]|uniref:YeeE/YedE thiosulfate transporter family protein n=1 Tax=Pyranulibacter aquaticus TaxID=3163344 RepID=UPI0035964EDF